MPGMWAWCVLLWALDCQGVSALFVLGALQEAIYFCVAGILTGMGIKGVLADLSCGILGVFLPFF